MKKILILETGAFHGRCSGGSYIQAAYYEKLLKRKGYEMSIFIGRSKENRFTKFWKVIQFIRKSDYVIGFGTPLLNSYLQWLCFFLNKKGLFCIDTIIVSIEIINDHLNKRIFSIDMIAQNIKAFLTHYIFIRIKPTRLNLKNFASCEYVKNKIINNLSLFITNQFLFPKVNLSYEKIKTNTKTVIFYGSLYRGRGVIDLLQACRILWKKRYNFKLVILGWPIEKLSLKTLKKETKTNDKDRILIKGKVDRVHDYIKKSTVVVLPFRYPCSFQTPYTLLEPMGLGVPVITTDVGSHSEWITHMETGLICRKEAPEDIAQKIEMILNDNNLAKKLTTNAHKLLVKRYREKDILLETLQKLENEKSILGKGKIQ